jgi:hypothetical protein
MLFNGDIGYSHWFNKIGYKIEEDIEQWIFECPSPFVDTSVINIQEALDSEYESFIGELQDRAYDEWRDEQ